MLKQKLMWFAGGCKARHSRLITGFFKHFKFFLNKSGNTTAGKCRLTGECGFCLFFYVLKRGFTVFIKAFLCC